ncbi:hypothetical protein BDV93DRAFT_49927 [Ceratobasidium sp. AG-I]|nr:hypothetical protein BDV93DRAFT_49927 [Ceratobasidium sp. AG-I]
MVTRQLPYSPYKHDSRVTQKIIQGELPGHRPDMGGTRSLSEPDAIWDIIDQCWSAADLRPSARYLLGQVNSITPTDCNKLNAELYSALA